MRKKLLVLLLAISVMATSLVGCGTEKTKTPEEGENVVIGNVDADKTVKIWSFSDE